MLQFLLLISLFITSAYAKRVRPLPFEEGSKTFTVPAEKGVAQNTKLYIYSKHGMIPRFDGEALIQECNPKDCQAKVSRIRKGVKLSPKHFFFTNKVDIKIYKHHAYVFVGSPLIWGYGAGYFYDPDENYRFGLSAGIMSHELGKIDVTGNFVTAKFERKLWTKSYFEFNSYAEAGLMRGKLDYSKLDGSDSTFSAPFAGAGLNTWYHSKGFFAFGKVGYTYNFLDDVYKDSNGDSFRNKFAGGLMTFEVGVGASF